MILVNGVETEFVPAQDRGFQFGDGLFETIAVIAGQPRLWLRHVARLTNGCERLSLPVPEASLLLTEIRRVAADRARTVVKIIVTRGTGSGGYAPAANTNPDPNRIVIARDWPADPAEWDHDGVPAMFCDTHLARNPRLAGIKHLNRLEQVLAQHEVSAKTGTGTGAEGIVCDTSGYVIETCRANLFAVFGDLLATPDLNQAGVAGVMRAEVMARATDAGIAVRESCFTPRELLAADEIFVTNALINVRPIRAVGDRVMRAGPVTRRVQEMLREAPVS